MEIVFISDESGGYLIINMPQYISKNYKGDERKFNDKEVHEIVSSYRIFIGS